MKPDDYPIGITEPSGTAGC